MPLNAWRGRPPRGLLALPAVAGYAWVAQWPLTSVVGTGYFVANVLVPLTFTATGVFLATDPEHRATGWAMGVAAAVWPLNWINEWHVGPSPLVASLVGPLASLPVAWALLRYPVRFRRRLTDRVVIGGLALVQLESMGVVVVSRPEWHGFEAGTPWLAWWPSWPAFRVLTFVYDAGGAALAALVLVGMLVRFRRLRGFDRTGMRPVVTAVVVAAGLTAAADLGAAGLLPAPVQEPASLVQTVALVGIPLAFLAAAIRRWLALGDLPALAVRLRRAPDGRRIQSALRSALRDPGLVLLYRGDEAGSDPWIDVDGHPHRADRRGRHAVELCTARGRPLGLLLGDAALRRHAALVDPIVRTAARVVESSRLQVLVLSRIAETRSSTARLAALLAVERRRLDDDLRAGPLHHVEKARAALAHLADGRDPEPGLLRERLDAVVRDLTDLGAGRPPDQLVRFGLATALAGLAGGPVTVTVPPGRFPAPVEAAAYFAVSELVVNALKHAGAEHIGVEAEAADGLLTLRVRDDGRGGADAHGSGLAGVRDRIRAVGGEFVLRSRPGAGTRVRLVVPCAERGETLRRAGCWPRIPVLVPAPFFGEPSHSDASVRTPS